MDINQLMKQAQVMQKKMKQMQEEIAKKEFQGKSGGGIVVVNMTGNGEMNKISIDPSIGCLAYVGFLSVLASLYEISNP